jgi:hypothetical protein
MDGCLKFESEIGNAPNHILRRRDPRLRADDVVRQDAAILQRKCLKIADDFAAKSADNALKFVNPARDCRTSPSKSEDHP